MPTALFVHGMYVTPRCWEAWEKHFRARGWNTLAPPWPEHDATVEEQRKRHPHGPLAALTLDGVVAHFRDAVAALPEKPLLIGHSMGGLVVQLLLQQGLGAAGVAIDSAPPKGVISLRWSFLKSNWPHITGNIDQPSLLSFEQFRYAFLNKMSDGEARAEYDRHAVPESRRVGRGPTTDAGKIDFARARPPLLLVAGGDDNIIPASLNRRNFERYRAGSSPTDFREFPGRTHWIIAEPGWQEVADHALDWSGKQAT